MKKTLSILLALAMVLSLTGAALAEADNSNITIGISMDAIESQMWTENQASMHAELDKLGVKYTEVIADGDAQKQNQQIETLIASGVKAIIIAPKDSTTIVSAIKKCNDAGIPVVMNNRGAGEGAVVGCSVASDNKAMVIREMEWVAEQAKTSGKTYKVMEFIGNLGDTNAVARHEGFKEVAQKYPEIFTSVIEIPTEWKAENADSLGQAALQANPDVNMIFTASDFLIPTVKAMLQKFDMWYPTTDAKHVLWVTFDGAADAVNEIKAGYIDIVSVQDATEQGRLCVENAVALAKGETVDPDAFDPGFEVTQANVEELGFAGY
ncbi:MAG TPA: sugar ABC transporter substrate-binding protein [Candidatus Limiplasma sp.]|nr:sugar ABC transporter substrate-binding protein [Candidatus Limiplasma sp.]